MYCVFPHILGSPSSYMTLHPIPFEFPYIWGKICSVSFLSVWVTLLQRASQAGRLIYWACPLGSSLRPPWMKAMMSKARGGWPNMAARLDGWRRMPQQVWFCTWWTGLTPCLFPTIQVALTGVAQLRAEGISISCYICTLTSIISHVTQRRHGLVLL
jgi:hypothetical protein